MAHETHHDTHDHHHHTVADARPTSSYRAAFWFVLILAGLFVAAVNFVGVMGHDEDGGKGHAGEHTKEQTASQTLSGETGLGKNADNTTQHHGSNAAADSAKVEGHESH